VAVKNHEASGTCEQISTANFAGRNVQRPLGQKEPQMAQMNADKIAEEHG
jgi:hypothetical protein